MRTLVFSLFFGLFVTACHDGSDVSGTSTDTADDATDTGVVDTTTPDTTVVDTTIADTADDTVEPDTTDPDVVVDGGFGWPCLEADDCNSGWCVEGRDGKTCSRTCLEECPNGYECRPVAGNGSDATFICVDITARLCQPCDSNDDCNDGVPNAPSLCVSAGDAGSYCALNCGNGGYACPDGYSCKTVDGAAPSVAQQCVPDNDECECGGRAIALALSTTCFHTNEHGSCSGSRVCGADGLTQCDAVEPLAEVCNGVDDDCDGEVDEGVAAVACNIENVFGSCPGTTACSDGGVEECVGTPPTDETCDGIDQNCDGVADEGFSDLDGDGIADCVDDDRDGDTIPNGADNCPDVQNGDQSDIDFDLNGDACDPDADGDLTPNIDDCAPFDATINPAGTETCNNKDDNCDDAIDEGFSNLDGDALADCVDDDIDGDGVVNEQDNCPVTANADQADQDNDGLGDLCEDDLDGDGDPDVSDCEPTNPLVHVGAPEVCNGSDDNCNQIADEGFADSDNDGTADCIDDDDDGDGVPDGDDNCPVSANPDQGDFDEDGIGDLCDPDDDNDGDGDLIDCGPRDPERFSGAIEVCGNTLDDDCDGQVDEENATGCETYYFNQDSDAFGIEFATKCLCGPSIPYSATEFGDCDDQNPQIFPNADEVCANNKDDNCDGEVDEESSLNCQPFYEDTDGDGYGINMSTRCLCVAEPGWAAEPGDCDDTESSVNPGETETCGTGFDDDCDGAQNTENAEGCNTYYYDADEDGYGLPGDNKCLCAPEGVYGGIQPGDCDDGDAERFPANLEVCDAKDNNCNGQVDEGVETTYYRDDDNDGFGGFITIEACPGDEPDGYSDQSGDCTDYNNQIFPGQTELCNEIDDDCNGQIDDGLPQSQVYVDLDGDGFGAENTQGVLDCLVDTDADGTGDAAPAGFSLENTDCNDSAASVFPDAPEQCDSILNDCNAPVVDFQCPTVCAGDWPFSIGVNVGYVTIGQLDADSELEVVAQGNGGAANGANVYVLEHDGTLKWSAPASVQYSYPSIADIDMDGYQDVVLHENGRIRILKGTTGEVLETHAMPNATGWRPGVAFDLNNDGHVDLVGAAGSTALRIGLRDGAGGISINSCAPPAGTYFGSDVPAVVDIEGDGIAEVMIGTGYFTCNDAGAPACDGRLLVYDSTDCTLKLDLPAGDNLNAYAGGPLPFVADVDADGERELAQYFGNMANAANAGVYAWKFDGTPLGLVLPGAGGSPQTAALDPTTGEIVPSGELRPIGGAAVDLDKDGKYETVSVGGSGIMVRQANQVMDGYPVSVSGGIPHINDINRDGRLDVLFLGSTNSSVNCYTMGNQTYSRQQVLTYGGVESLGGNTLRTSNIDPYEPNDKASVPFVPATSTNPIADSRAVPMRGFFESFNASSGERRELVAMIGSQGDVDHYWATGRHLNVFVEALSGPIAYDISVHMFKADGAGGYTYITTRDGTEPSATVDDVYCHVSDFCPDAANNGTKLFIIEVRGEDPATDYGPWPYRLKINWGAR